MLNLSIFGGNCTNSKFLFSGISKTNSTNTYTLENATYRVYQDTCNFLDSTAGEFSLYFPDSKLVSGKFIVLVDIGLNLEKNNVQIVMSEGSKLFGVPYTNNLFLNQNSSIYFFFYSGEELGWVYSIYYLDTALNPLKFNYLFYADSNYLKNTRFLYQADLILDSTIKTHYDTFTTNITDLYNIFNSERLIDKIIEHDGSGSGLDADLLDGVGLGTNTTSGSTWPFVPFVKTDGTSEIGHTIDFHNISNDPNDYSIRLSTNGTSTDLYINGYKIYHTNNDGAGSGLDADLLDGQQGTYYLNWLNFTNIPTTISGYGITDAYTKTQTDANITTAINKLIDSSPATLDTLREIATALNNDPNFYTSMTSLINTKVNNSDYTGAVILSKLVTVDGHNSGLNADLLDGYHSTSFQMALGFTPVEQGYNGNKIKIGWSGTKLKASVDTLDLGNFVFESGLSTNADTLDGYHASAFAFTTGSNVSGTWPINITGNSAHSGSSGNADTVDGYHASAFQMALGFTPVEQGYAGNKIKIGWSGSTLKATVDSTDLGAFLFSTGGSGMGVKSIQRGSTIIPHYTQLGPGMGATGHDAYIETNTPAIVNIAPVNIDKSIVRLSMSLVYENNFYIYSESTYTVYGVRPLSWNIPRLDLHSRYTVEGDGNTRSQLENMDVRFYSSSSIIIGDKLNVFQPFCYTKIGGSKLTNYSVHTVGGVYYGNYETYVEWEVIEFS